MKKLLVVLLVLMALAVYFESNRYRLGLFGVTWVLDSDRYSLDTKAAKFLEFIQFKNFTEAATLHHPDERGSFDISTMIESKFKIKPELLDISHFEILRVDVSRDGKNAKTVFKATMKIMNTKEVRDVEGVFYWRKQEGQWWMALRSSL